MPLHGRSPFCWHRCGWLALSTSLMVSVIKVPQSGGVMDSTIEQGEEGSWDCAYVRDSSFCEGWRGSKLPPAVSLLKCLDFCSPLCYNTEAEAGVGAGVPAIFWAYVRDAGADLTLHLCHVNWAEHPGDLITKSPRRRPVPPLPVFSWGPHHHSTPPPPPRGSECAYCPELGWNILVPSRW